MAKTKKRKRQLKKPFRDDDCTGYIKNKQRYLHSYDGHPAYTGTTLDSTTYKWYKHGKLHRVGELPAAITATSKEISRRWVENGKWSQSREFNFERIAINGNEVVRKKYSAKSEVLWFFRESLDSSEEEWSGTYTLERFNNNLPVRIVSDAYNDNKLEVFFLDTEGVNTLTKSFHKRGSKLILDRIEYERSGYLHREDGPAVIVYNAKGLPKAVEFWINGDLHDNSEQLAKEYIANARFMKEVEEVLSQPGAGDV